jgi:hypothetical protein
MSPLERLQRFMAARADVAAELQYVPAFVIRDLTIRSRIDAALAGMQKKNGKAGVAIQVLPPTISVPHPNAPGPLCLVRIAVRCQENPVINTSGINAEEVALFLLSYFQGWSPGFGSNLRPASKGEALVPSLEFAPLLTYTAVFEMDLTQRQTVKAAQPTITVEGDTVTMSSALEGAEVWYTLDETLPRPANGDSASNGTLYAGPIDKPAAGTLITAAAFGTGTWGSNAVITEI